MTHSELFSPLFKGSMPYYISPEPAKKRCLADLEDAIRLAERIDEVSCGLWEVKLEKKSRFFRAEKLRATIIVNASPAFLRKMGVEIQHKGVKDDAPVSPVHVYFDCNVCAREFVQYCQRRWTPEVFELRGVGTSR